MVVSPKDPTGVEKSNVIGWWCTKSDDGAVDVEMNREPDRFSGVSGVARKKHIRNHDGGGVKYNLTYIMRRKGNWSLVSNKEARDSLARRFRQ